MYNILFICYGNICRSPMAEMIFKDLIYKNNKKYMFNCDSKATSMEEFGNGIYPKAKKVLEDHNVTIEKHYASMVKKEDYDKYNYIICMDNMNYNQLISIFNGDKDNKIKMLMSFTNNDEEIEDPWYTNRFEKVYDQINKGCNGLFNYLVEKSKIDFNGE